MGLQYAFRQEIYDHAPARTRNGAVRLGNPDEEDFYHRARIEGRWKPNREFRFTLAYEFERKDDRFQNFESYDNHFVFARTQWEPEGPWRLNLTFGYEHRDFDNRGAASGTLEYDRFFVSPGVRYELSERLALYSYYTFSDRDSNRNIGNAFRDQEIHRVLSGISFSY